MKIARKTQSKNEISTSSMPDIIFMLLIFFMVTTVMREFDGLNVLMPRAKMIEKLESKRHTTYIWATKDGFTVLDDMQFSNLTNEDNAMLFKKSMIYKVRNNPRITVSLKADSKAKMSLITNLHKLLQDPDVNALKLNYSALRKSE